ncbi:MAG: IclR family transcriptional regulator [Rhodovibrionaceae bacterium]
MSKLRNRPTTKQATTTAPAAAPTRGAARILKILDFALANGGGVRINEIVDGLRIPQSTAYELVRILIAAGYLEQSRERGVLSLGRKLYELGMTYRSQVDLLKDGEEIVHALSRELGETVQLSVLDNDRMLVLLKEEGTRPLRIISKIGSQVPINWAAAGRLLVSDMDAAELRDWLPDNVLPSPTGTAPLDPDLLASQIREFRARGYGIEIGEANEHAGCVAAPVLDRGGRCIAAISIAAPEYRLSESQRPGIIDAVCKAAQALSDRLGALPVKDAG